MSDPSGNEHGEVSSDAIVGAGVADMRALVGAMLGSEQVASLDEPSLRALSTVLLERMLFARQAGLSFHGARDVYEVLGYNRILTYRDYRATYMRGGLAKRIVDAYPNAIWRAGAEVYEDEQPETETEFERAWELIEQKHGIWARLCRAHKLASLSTYSVLLIGAAGDLGDELPRGRPDTLLYLQPFSGGGGPGGGDQQDNRSRAMNADATIVAFDQDPRSERFGLPLTYQLKRTSLSSPLLERPVHWSRIIHVAPGLLGDEVYGTPVLEAVWNYLDDLMKVVGGGGEAFWLRANAGLHLDVDKAMGMPSNTPGKARVPGVGADERKALRERAEELQHQLQRVIVTKGVTATQLGSNVADFKNPADAIVTLIAGTVGIPKRILVGSEMGQLASGQDKDNWNTQVQDARTSWAFHGLVKPLVDRLVQYGYLPAPKEFHVEWPVIEDLTETEKAELAKAMAEVNKMQEAVVYTEDEIREKCWKHQPLTDEQAAQGLSEMQKAEIAAKLALTNKEMGLTVFSPAEIRRIAYQLAPLPEAEQVPVGAPEKISVTSPPRQPGDEPTAALPAGEPLAATLAALEAAIEADDAEAVGRLIGLSSPASPQQTTVALSAPAPPHVTVNMPEPRSPEPPTVVVNVPPGPREPVVIARDVEYDEVGRIQRLVNVFEVPDSRPFDADTYRTEDVH